MVDVTVGLHYLFLTHFAVLLVAVLVTIRLLNPRRFNHKFHLKSGEKSTRRTAFLNLDKMHADLPESERSFVVFLSGFRVHSWTRIILLQLKSLLKFNRYTGIVLKPKDRMPNYEDGCIGSFKYGSLLGDSVLVQYWRSFDHLTKFAKKRDHIGATRHYEKTLQERGYIGGWHETFLVHNGDYESLYFNMPPHMMASLPEADVEVVDVDRKTKSAKKRRLVGMNLAKHSLHTSPASASSRSSSAKEDANMNTEQQPDQSLPPQSSSSAEDAAAAADSSDIAIEHPNQSSHDVSIHVEG